MLVWQADYYTASYCEENCHFLARQLLQALPSAEQEPGCVLVVFVSNPAKQVPLWRQKAGRDEDGLVCWDYHVLCLSCGLQGQCLVWDLDRQAGHPLGGCCLPLALTCHSKRLCLSAAPFPSLACSRTSARMSCGQLSLCLPDLPGNELKQNFRWLCVCSTSPQGHLPLCLCAQAFQAGLSSTVPRALCIRP